MQMVTAIPALQRARGRAEVTVSFRDGAVRLDRLFQQGCAKALLPRTHGGPFEAVFVNTAGGVAGGDELNFALTAGDRSELVATSQAAERAYRSNGPTARVTTRLAAGENASLAWLPQETILFDGCRLDRRLEADIAGNASLTALECVALGRAAMGEIVTRGAFRDQWRIRRGGRLVHAEALRLEGDFARLRSGAATLNGARAFATIIHVAEHAEARLDTARAALGTAPGVTAAASARPGLLIVRLLAPDLAPLRAALIRFLMAFRATPLPRVWTF